MTASIEYLIIRAFPQSSGGSDPKRVPGGLPKYSTQHIQMVQSIVKGPAYYAMMSCHGDEMAEARLMDWTKTESIREWHENPINHKVPATTRELHRIAEVAVIKFIQPRNNKGEMWPDAWAWKYIGHGGQELSEKKWRARFRNHQHYLEGRLDALWQQAERTINNFITESEEGAA